MSVACAKHVVDALTLRQLDQLTTALAVGAAVARLLASSERATIGLRADCERARAVGTSDIADAIAAVLGR